MNGADRIGDVMKSDTSSTNNELQNKWATWTMKPEKKQLSFKYFASALVIAASAFVVVGLHQHAIF
ncbi:hypothetical protein [Ruegeria arenilitoris]|uniref:hypothetical protein n=2 Tax=Ruegeria TaxID=97050 RepID=UPI0014805475|nr:hypothetical protein [Ruegeria arenilitoris]